MAIDVKKIEIEGVQDASNFAALIEQGELRADDVIAVIGKTEGNGGVNDFTRILADLAFRKVLLDHGQRSADDELQRSRWSGPADVMA